MFEKLRMWISAKVNNAVRSVLLFALSQQHRGAMRGSIGVATLIALAVGVMMLGILLPIGLSSWESYVPTGATLKTIWPIGAVLIVLGIVLGFFRDSQ